MEQRELDISIYGNYEWTIELRDMKHYDTYDSASYMGFAIAKVEDKKIVYLCADCISDEMIGNDNTMLQEECIFTHNKHSFSGTFTDALEYIKEEMNDGV
jgi:hypothetical protein